MNEDELKCLIVAGIETCNTEADAINLFKDVFEAGKKQGRKEAYKEAWKEFSHALKFFALKVNEITPESDHFLRFYLKWLREKAEVKDDN